MRLYASLALVGIFLIVTQPMLRAQDSKGEQARAIAEIKKLGGTVQVDANRPERPVVGVNLKHTKDIDASLEHLKGLTELELLHLKDTAVTDDGLVYVKGLTNLEVLELRRIKVTDKGLVHLKGFTKLQRLDLGNTEVTDKGLERLKGFTKLEILSLDGTKVTDAGLAHLQGLTSLETLNLENTIGVSDAGLAHLKGLINLGKLNLEGTKVTHAGVDDLQKALPKVKIVHGPVVGTIARAGFAASAPPQEQQTKQNAQAPDEKAPGKGLPDLVGVLKATKGCLGVETAKTSSGKNVIFAWFEDKQAVLRWYYSDTHQAVMKKAFNKFIPQFDKPLEGVPDDVGPVLVIASITYAKEPRFKDVPLPISQIAIEIYKPVTGGIFLGSRFAPDSVKVPGIKDYTPKKSKE